MTTIFKFFFAFILVLNGSVYAQDHSNFSDQIEQLLNENLDSARSVLLKAEKTTAKNNHHKLGEIYHFIGVAEKRLHKKYKALEYFNLSLAQKKLVNDQESISKTLNLIGTIHHESRAIDEALDFYLKAISLLKEDSTSVHQTSPRLNIARLYIDLNEFEKAKAELVQTEYFITLNKDTAETPIVENLWGMLYQNANQLDSAKVHYQKSLDYNLKYGSKTSLANSFNNMAIIYFYENKTPTSYNFFKKAYTLRKEAKDTIAQLASLSNLGDFHQELNTLDSALYFYQKGLQLSLKKGADIDTRDFYYSMSTIYEKLNQKTLALSYYKNYINYYQKAEKNKSIKRLEELEAKYQFKQQENKLQNSRKTNLELITANKAVEKERQKAKDLNTLLLILTILLGITVLSISYILYTNKKLSRNLKETAISKEEKVTLIKEIHHRVKNNLQIITSLLRLQAYTIEDEKSASYFVDCEKRVAAMALVHEKLYKSNNFSAINLAEYIDELVRNLIASYASNYLVIKKTNIEVEELDLDTIIPVSLIINECITNSFKHGYTPEKEEFSITCNITIKNKKFIHLYIGDNGKGFPQGFSLKSSNSLGVELIESLIDQIDGTVEIINENGAYYNILFPLKKK
ncbi:MAG: hypothetical protein N4A35_13310 [Flavobacteriales bacterium]|jgi:two-component sensor histidine kinase|nr:hypothetical protein [Flavobacteriales bacterium]